MINIIKDVLAKRRVTIREGESVSKYMIQRWISFRSPEVSALLNETTNQLYNVLDEQMMVDFLHVILPVKTNRLPKYLKKEKTNKTKGLSKDELSVIARNFEISVRELKQILKDNPDVEKELKKNASVFKRIN